MKLSLLIGKRYLFAHKKQNAVNIISIIGTIGLCLGTFALISVLSVFNGIDSVIQSASRSVSPSVVISAQNKGFTSFEPGLLDSLKKIRGIDAIEQTLTENAMMKYLDRIRPVKLKGVRNSFVKNTGLENKIIAGKAMLSDTSSSPCISAGYGVAADLGLEFSAQTPITLYYPDKHARSVSTKALRAVSTHLGGVFSFDQTEDSKLVLIDQRTAQELFQCPHQYSEIEIFINNEKDIKTIKEQIKSLIKEPYTVKDKFEINRNFYSMMRGEKLAVFIVMLFVILIASFNVIASMSMLLIDKKESIFVFRSMGMRKKSISDIFFSEGMIMIVTGILSGLLLGCLFTVIQEKWGIITLGEGNYISSAYPVKLVAEDVLAAVLSITAIAIAAISIPIRFLINKWIKE